MDQINRKNPFEEVFSGQKDKKEIIWSTLRDARIILSYEGIVSNIDNLAFSAYKGEKQKEIFRKFDRRKIDELFYFFSRRPLFSDGEHHREAKKVIGTYFHNIINNDLNSYLEDVAGDLLSKINLDIDTDIVQEYCYPFSIVYLSKVLGIDVEDIKKLHGWTKSIIDLMGLREYNEELISNALCAYDEVKDYIAQATVNSTKGFIYYLKQNVQLEESDVLAIVGNILIDGYEPTALTIASGIKYSLEYPEILDHIKNGGNISDIVYEINRLVPIFPYTSRLAKSNVTILGEDIIINQRIIFMLLTANKDDRKFTDPNIFDIKRPNNKNNLTFGVGKHACVGRGLAHHGTSYGLMGFYDKMLTSRKDIKITDELFYDQFYLKGHKQLNICTSILK